MEKFENLFVVYDPTGQEQPALERAADLARTMPVKIHVFTCIYSNTAKPAEVKSLIAEHQSILEAVVAPLREQGIAVSTEVEWDKNWCQAAVRASITNSSDLVLKPSYKHSSSKRFLNKTSDWTLIRECLCPVLLVKENSSRYNPRVLAAIDICAKNESYERLNQNVINFGNQIIDNRGAEVYYINAFQDFKGVPDRQELIRNTGLASNKIHIKLGEPDKVIIEQAKKLDVSLVVVGNSARSGLSAAFLGNTVEKVLDNVECDVLSMR
ncbi:MAG: universal stress protein E [Halieaceae bacterium]|jgi:universal stress protein E